MDLEWAPRVERAKIHRLYQSEASGRLDDEVLDDVGVGLYARCESILRLTDAYVRGRVECPACHRTIEMPVAGRHRNKEMPIVCPDCGWSTTWLVFKRSFRDKRLHAGNAEAVFRQYVEKYPSLRSPAERMLLIDWLLHEFHKVRWRGESGMAASNLIEGTPRGVMTFLDELAGLRPEPEREAWRARLAASGTGRKFRFRHSPDEPARPPV